MWQYWITQLVEVAGPIDLNDESHRIYYGCAVAVWPHLADIGFLPL